MAQRTTQTSMTLHILTRELEAMHYACAIRELNCKVTPTERQGIVRVRISYLGRELTPEMGYFLREEVQRRLQVVQEAEAQELPLTESDLMPNDVVILVESLEDLPR